MTLSRFRAEPRDGHLERCKRVYHYLNNKNDGAIRVRTELPDRSEFPDQDYDWCHTVYGDVEELLPTDAPEPLGKPVDTTTYVDANLYHDFITGRAVTGVLHMVNKTPIDWYTKRQATVETATYSSEFVAARTATDQIIDLRYTLRYLGVPLAGPSYMFGDNKSVVTSSTIPHSPLSKRHQFLAYHRVREAIAAKIVKFFHIGGTMNPADILSKHCGFSHAWPLICTLLFWTGDTTYSPDSVKTKDTTAEDNATQVSDIGEYQPSQSVAKVVDEVTDKSESTSVRTEERKKVMRAFRRGEPMTV